MSTLPTYLKSLDILELKFALEFLILTGIWLHIFLSPSFYAWRKPPRDILTLTETESRLSLGMTSNKTYHFQTTANHHRFIKVWTSIADLPTSKFFSKLFFLKKYDSEIPYLPKIWTFVQNFVIFFNPLLTGSVLVKFFWSTWSYQPILTN